jgi:hypothetical protein
MILFGHTCIAALSTTPLLCTTLIPSQSPYAHYWIMSLILGLILCRSTRLKHMHGAALLRADSNSHHFFPSIVSRRMLLNLYGCRKRFVEQPATVISASSIGSVRVKNNNDITVSYRRALEIDLRFLRRPEYRKRLIWIYTSHQQKLGDQGLCGR